jgi:hypothetical protein
MSHKDGDGNPLLAFDYEQNPAEPTKPLKSV